MHDPWIRTAILWAAAMLAVLASWPARRFQPLARLFVMLVLMSITLGLPWLIGSEAPMFARIVSTLGIAAVLSPKVFDAYRDADDWTRRPFSQWVRFIFHPQVLVWHRHVTRHAQPKGPAARLLLRAAVEITLGVALFNVANRFDLGARSFWLEHVTKLVAGYLFGLDGAISAVGALLRLCGSPIIDLSRHPILACTPADFWRRYNRTAGEFLHDDVFLPLGGARNPVPAIFFTFLINGLLHEYLAFTLIGRVQGYQTLFFILHGFAVAATFRFRPRHPAALALGTLATFTFNVITSVLFLASVNSIVPWYSHGGLLP